MTNNSFHFQIDAKEKHSRARIGKIKTAYNSILTPAFVPVGSGATIKALTPSEIHNCGIDVIFVNTYHMFFRPGTKVIKSMGGLHKFMNWQGSIMTDSGGFQAFSLGEYGPNKHNNPNNVSLVKINDNGIEFKSIWDGKKALLTPEISIKAQGDLGSDIIMSFDECTFYPISKNRAKKAMERTHRWALAGLNVKKSKQALYGIIQGSVYRDLRETSAKYISKLPFEGFAIGSVANSKEPREKVFAVLDWSVPLLPQNKPVHFLGVGEIEDIFIGVTKGIDSFDCVTPTRMGRMGWVFSKHCGAKNKFRFDIAKAAYSLDKQPIDKSCQCFVCSNFSRGYLNHLFRNRELLAYRLATFHNLYFYGSLMKKIREAIFENKLNKLLSEWMKN